MHLLLDRMIPGYFFVIRPETIINTTYKRNGALMNVLAERLHDFTVGVTNTLPTTTSGPHKLPQQVCLQYNGAFPPGTWMLNCTTIARGRYVFIQIRKDGEKNGGLTLCEVEVYCKFTQSKYGDYK